MSEGSRCEQEHCDPHHRQPDELDDLEALDPGDGVPEPVPEIRVVAGLGSRHPRVSLLQACEPPGHHGGPQAGQGQQEGETAGAPSPCPAPRQDVGGGRSRPQQERPEQDELLIPRLPRGEMHHGARPAQARDHHVEGNEQEQDQACREEPQRNRAPHRIPPAPDRQHEIGDDGGHGHDQPGSEHHGDGLRPLGGRAVLEVAARRPGPRESDRPEADAAQVGMEPNIGDEPGHQVIAHPDAGGGQPQPGERGHREPSLNGGGNASPGGNHADRPRQRQPPRATHQVPHRQRRIPPGTGRPGERGGGEHEPCEHDGVRPDRQFEVAAPGVAARQHGYHTGADAADHEQQRHERERTSLEAGGGLARNDVVGGAEERDHQPAVQQCARRRREEPPVGQLRGSCQEPRPHELGGRSQVRGRTDDQEHCGDGEVEPGCSVRRRAGARRCVERAGPGVGVGRDHSPIPSVSVLLPVLRTATLAPGTMEPGGGSQHSAGRPRQRQKGTEGP